VCAIFSARLRNGQRPSIFEDGRQTRDFVHVADIVQANLLAMERRPAPARRHVGTGADSVAEIARLLRHRDGTTLEPEINGQFPRSDIRHCAPNIARARAFARLRATA